MSRRLGALTSAMIDRALPIGPSGKFDEEQARLELGVFGSVVVHVPYDPAEALAHRAALRELFEPL